jgi:anti-sigma factor RsiW
MMTCAQLEEFVIDYVEGSLPLRRRAAFALHLLFCPKCRAYLAAYRQTLALGRRLFADPDKPAAGEAPEELIQAILAARPTGRGGGRP